MTLLGSTPTDTAELLDTIPPEAHADPGDRLAGHPHAPNRGEETPGPADGEGPIVELSEPIPADQLDANTPYVILDEFARALCVENAGSGTWDWAYFGAYNNYWTDVFPLTFTGNPTKAAETLVMRPNTWPLHANGKATSWEYAFWASSTYNSSYPVMPLFAKLAQVNPNGYESYRLSWNNGGTAMNLCTDSGSWNWAYVSSTKSAAMLTFHKFYVRHRKLGALFKATWPKANINLQVNVGDEYYEAVTPAQVMSIYHDSGLAGYNWKPNYFDCDDFSYVYKAQASKNAYAAAPEYGYAVGVIFASAPTGDHAVNVFIDTSGTVQIVEPQNGQIVEGKNWKDSGGTPYSPFFILM